MGPETVPLTVTGAVGVPVTVLFAPVDTVTGLEGTPVTVTGPLTVTGPVTVTVPSGFVVPWAVPEIVMVAPPVAFPVTVTGAVTAPVLPPPPPQAVARQTSIAMLVLKIVFMIILQSWCMCCVPNFLSVICVDD